MSELVLRLFGTTRVWVEGEPLPRMRSRKARWLLALLALRGGGPAGRNTVAGMLWPDAEPTVALTNLRSVVSDLRRALGAQAHRLQTPDRKTLALDLSGAEVDVLDFDAALRDGDLSRVVERYTGPLMEDCDEEWILQERGVRERACLRALRDLAEMASPEAAVALCQRSVEIAPWQDGPRRDLMNAYLRVGDLNAALAAYRDYAQALRAETGGTPDLQTTELYVRLRSGENKPSILSPSLNGSLPNPITSFIGREDEQIEIAKDLQAHRLVTLTGMGGVGKTRLAREVAQAASSADGAWFIPLEAVHSGDGVLRAVASALRIKERPDRPLSESLIDHLRTKRLLLVLDNGEHLVGACAQLADRLLSECPGLRILVTSREPLGLVGEKVWPVLGLTVPHLRGLPNHPATLLRVLMGYESVRLFVERAETASNFALVRENASAVAELCELLEGLPLALELAASRTRTMSVEDMVARLWEHRLDLLVGSRHVGAPRHQTLRAALDWSYSLLGPEERRLLARLSVFSGGWTLEAAEAVADATPTLLQSLVEKSLVTFNPSGRYGFLETVRQYAAERSGASEARPRHLRWYAVLAERLADESAPVDRYEREMGNFRAAMGAAVDDPEAALQLVGGMGAYWNLVRNDEEGQRHLREALDRPGAQEPTASRARALHYLGALTFNESASDASPIFKEALQVATVAGDRRRAAMILRAIALKAYFDGEFDASATHHEASMEIARSIGDRQLVAINIGGLSLTRRHHGDYPQARALGEESVGIFRELGQTIWMAWELRSLGQVAHDQGDYSAMKAVNEEALAIFRSEGVEEGVAWCLDDLGKVATETGHLALGEDLLGQSLHAMRNFDVGIGAASVLNSLGENALAQGDLAKARAYQSESLAVFKSFSHRLGVARTLNGLGDVAIATRDFADAEKHYREALAIWLAVSDQKRIRDGFLRLGSVASDLAQAIPLWVLAARRNDALRIAVPRPLLVNHQAAIETARRDSSFELRWKAAESMPDESLIALALSP